MKTREMNDTRMASTLGGGREGLEWKTGKTIRRN